MAEPAGTTTAGQSAGSGAPNGEHWTAQLPENLRGFAMQQGWKDPAAAVASYQNALKIQRTPVDRTVVVPDDGDANGWAAVFGRLGMPTDPNGYKFPDGMNVPDDQRALFTKLAHDAHLTTRQWDALVKPYVDAATKQQKDADAAFEAKRTNEWTDLQRSWGDSFHANCTAAGEAMRRFGFSEQDVDKIEAQLGTRRTVEFFHSLGRGMGEQPFAGGGPGSGAPAGASEGFGMTPEAALARLDSLNGDPAWRQRMLSKDNTVVQSALAEQLQLATIAKDLIEQRMARGGLGGLAGPRR